MRHAAVNADVVGWVEGGGEIAGEECLIVVVAIDDVSAGKAFDTEPIEIDLAFGTQPERIGAAEITRRSGIVTVEAKQSHIGVAPEAVQANAAD